MHLSALPSAGSGFDRGRCLKKKAAPNGWLGDNHRVPQLRKSTEEHFAAFGGKMIEVAKVRIKAVGRRAIKE
jgi:hypothetical protein